MDIIRLICSAPLVIFISIVLLVVFYKTGIPSSESDVLAPPLDLLSAWIHGHVFITLFLYWTAAFFINRFQ